jgi:hypothetical protein
MDQIAQMVREAEPGFEEARAALIVALIGTVLVLSTREGGILARLTNPVVASLADSMNAQGDVSIEKDATLHRGSFKLRQGYAHLVFRKGTQVWIEAPAELTLRSAGKMTKRSGRLFADVPGSGRGFTVDTPCGRIVDLGTQFGVRVESDRASDMRLFKGWASLTPETGGRAGRMILLSREEAKQVTADGTVRDIPLGKTDFVRKIDSRTGFAWRGEPVNLADLLAGGDGFNTGMRAFGMDPGSGAIKDGELNTRMKVAGKKGYFPVAEGDPHACQRGGDLRSG